MDKLPQEFLFIPLGFKLHALQVFTAVYQNYIDSVHPVYIDNMHLSFLFDDIPIETRLVFCLI